MTVSLYWRIPAREAKAGCIEPILRLQTTSRRLAIWCASVWLSYKCKSGCFRYYLAAAKVQTLLPFKQIQGAVFYLNLIHSVG
jgi:hypothetical protein